MPDETLKKGKKRFRNLKREQRQHGQRRERKHGSRLRGETETGNKGGKSIKKEKEIRGDLIACGRRAQSTGGPTPRHGDKQRVCGGGTQKREKN